MATNPPVTVGDTIVLSDCTDPYSAPPPGTRGVVTFIDDTGTIFVDWDNGTRLGLLPGVDAWSLPATPTT